MVTISTTTIIRDEQNNPIPQYYNPATQVFEATEGANGSPNVQTTGAPLSAVSTLQNAATATGTGTSMSVSQYGVALIAISGTFVATITFQSIGPDGLTYPINAKNILTGAVASTATATGLYEVDTRGLISVIANITAYTSGSVTVKGQAQAVSASGQQVAIAGSNTFYAGTLTTSTTAAALGASQSCSEILVQSDPSNTTNVKVGNSAAQTIVITPGASMSISVVNVADIYAVAVSGTPQINWLARS